MTIEAFIRKHLPSYESKEVVLPFQSEQQIIESNTVITDYGQTEDKIFLLREGVTQVSALKGEEERILEFIFPNEFFSAYTSFLLHEPSDVQITTLARCSVSIIRGEDLVRANETSLVSNHLSLYITQQLFLSRARREKDFLTLSAEERYRRLLEKEPEVVKLIPGNKIAKYLGIQPESLSRIRKSIIP